MKTAPGALWAGKGTRLKERVEGEVKTEAVRRAQAGRLKAKLHLADYSVTLQGTPIISIRDRRGRATPVHQAL